MLGVLNEYHQLVHFVFIDIWMLEHDSAKLGAGNLVDVNALTMNISYQGVILSLECNMDFVEEEAEILLRKEI